jgi:putative transposase
MRQARLTWKGAFHHVMNRGLGGKFIFDSDDLKKGFLDLLKEKSKKLKIRIFAFCILGNHFHLILQNTSGEMSEFMKVLSGTYGQFYHRTVGGKGYVFQGRYKSTIIENESYLLNAIGYVLANPVRAKLVEDPFEYNWSSIHEYFCGKTSNNIENHFIEELFGAFNKLKKCIAKFIKTELPVKRTKFGGVYGTDEFYEAALKKYDRRKRSEYQHFKRDQDFEFTPVEQIIIFFENKYKVKIDSIDTSTKGGKQLRGELLVLLRDRSNMKYQEISKLAPFFDIHFSSLRGLYRRMAKKY